jgi:predicted DNA-binding transcriptional regulator AlpA
MKLLSPHELRSLKGISYSKSHLWRLTRVGKFPAPVKLGDNRNAYVESEVARDTASVATH